ncbi:Dynein regulatory complex subunit 4, partial [Perkinsus chesapeaki]
DERVLHLRQDYDRKARDLMQKYALRMRDIRDDCENKRKAELQRVEASKNREEIKAYYGDITSSNLELIKRLKEEHAELRKREMADAKLMRELKRKNAALSDPLKRAKSEVEELKETHARYLEDKRKIGVLKDEIAEQEKTLAAHSFKLAVLEQQLEAVSSERDTVVEQFQSMVYEVQQKSGMKNLLLEKKLENLEESLEVADAQVSELMMSAGGGPAAAEGVSRKLDSVMANKNDAISGLQEERRRLQEAHAQLVRSFESKLAEYGVPREDLGFEPRLVA